MSFQPIAPTDHFAAVMAAMRERGLLLAAYDKRGRANAMTIGWGSVGVVWRLPMWTVLVRPSRYTYECLEHSAAFSVNVPGPELAEACALCGSRSGRDLDKLAACGLQVEKGAAVNAPILPACPIIYQCRVVHKNDLVPATLADKVIKTAYAGGDYHRVYFGEILSAQADAERKF